MPPSMVVCVAEEIRKGNNKMGKCTDCKNLVFSSEYMDEERDIRRGWCCEADHHGEDYHYIIDAENDCKFFVNKISDGGLQQKHVSEAIHILNERK